MFAFAEIRRTVRVTCDCVSGCFSTCRLDELINAGARRRNAAPAGPGGGRAALCLCLFSLTFVYNRSRNEARESYPAALRKMNFPSLVRSGAAFSPGCSLSSPGTGTKPPSCQRSPSCSGPPARPRGQSSSSNRAFPLLISQEELPGLSFLF